MKLSFVTIEVLFFKWHSFFLFFENFLIYTMCICIIFCVFNAQMLIYLHIQL